MHTLNAIRLFGSEFSQFEGKVFDNINKKSALEFCISVDSYVFSRIPKNMGFAKTKFALVWSDGSESIFDADCTVSYGLDGYDGLVSSIKYLNQNFGSGSNSKLFRSLMGNDRYEAKRQAFIEGVANYDWPNF